MKICMQCVSEPSQHNIFPTNFLSESKHLQLSQGIFNTGEHDGSVRFLRNR